MSLVEELPGDQIQASLHICEGFVPGPPVNTEIHRCPKSLVGDGIMFVYLHILLYTLLWSPRLFIMHNITLMLCK